MTTFALGAAVERAPVTAYTLDPSGAISPEPAGPPDVQPIPANDQPSSAGTHTANTLNKPTGAVTKFPAEEFQASSGGFYWFERFHVVPRSFDFGNLLSDQSVAIVVFSAFRRDVKEWASFTNNAGTGVTLTGAPSLPASTDPLTGYSMTLDVSTNGPPFVDDTLDFAFTGIGTTFVPIMIQRIVLWALSPETSHRERLAFLTDVYAARSGKEKRRRLRKRPRRSWDYLYRMDDDEMRVLENLLFDFQALNFGVPIHFEDSTLTVAASASSTTITVDGTAYRDYREGGFAVIVTDQSTFDVLEIDSGGITSTSLTFTAPTVNAYPVGTKVYPLATCFAPSRVQGGRYQVNLREMQIRWRMTNNDVDLADLSAFSSFNGKLLLDNGNSLRGRILQNSYRQDVVEIDGEAGQFTQSSTWDRNKHAYPFTLRADGRQAVWEMRQMLYAIGGRWQSFYAPHDSPDLLVVAELTSGSNTMDVQNDGYNQFVRERQPRNVVRVTTTAGVEIIRTVLSSTMPSSTVDRLTLDANWPSTIAAADVASVDYIEKVRLDTDDVEIEYDEAGTLARMRAPVVAVFE